MSVKKANISSIISKGAPVKEDVKDDAWTHISLRIPKHLINTIDSQVSKTIGLTRTGWILQTLQRATEKEEV